MRHTSPRGEVLRKMFRSVLPTAIFRSVSASADWAEALRRLPPHEASELMKSLSRPAGATQKLLTLHPTTLKHPFQLRAIESDSRSFLGTCIRSEYGPVFPTQPPEYVVDAGAYTGDCSALILTRYPAARLVALEPQSDAFTLASTNLAPYGAVVRKEALWSSDGTLACTGTGMAMSVSRQPGDVRVSCSSMERVLAAHAFPRLDLLKCDIEGAEAEVFSAGRLEWLQRTKCVLIELHGAEAVRRVHAACRDSGLKFVTQYRSTHVFRR